MLKQIALFLPVFVAGLVLGAWAREPVNNPPAVSGASAYDHAADYTRLEQMITALTEVVNLEVAERRRLEDKLDSIADQVALLGGASDDNDGNANERLAAAEQPAVRRSRGQFGNISANRFIEAGFSPDVAERLKRDIDQIELDRLYLRDQAVREGWMGSQRYRDEMRDINQRQQTLREDLSEDDYDRYLYALGRPNRVTVSSVLTGSPADNSGLLPGDDLISYDGQRIHSPGEIRRATSQGAAGELVPVEVIRNGQRQLVYLPRGPLGVNMSATSTKP